MPASINSRPTASCLKTWGEPGTDPGQFNIVHNIVTDADGWVYVADRENHRVQVFDGNGKYEAQWNNLHRPCALHCCGGKHPNFIVGELGPGMPVNLKAPNLGPRLTIVDAKGKRIARLGGENGPGPRDRQIPRAARHRAGFEGRHLCRRSRRHQLEDQLSRYADAAEVRVGRCLQKLEKIWANGSPRPACGERSDRAAIPGEGTLREFEPIDRAPRPQPSPRAERGEGALAIRRGSTKTHRA